MTFSFIKHLFVIATIIVSSSVFGVTASQLTRDFFSNKLRADSIYLNRSIAVTGKITRIASSNGIPLVGLQGDGSKVVVCHFPKSLASTLFNLKSGDKTTIRGRCTSGSRNSVVLESCIIQPSGIKAPVSSRTSISQFRLTNNSMAKLKQTIVTIEGEKGKGTGFLCKLPNGKIAIITNAHVIWRNHDAEFLDMQGNNIEIASRAFAKHRDLAYLYPAEPNKYPYLEMEPNCSLIPTGSPVCVLGNSQGAGVTTEIFGAITGVGPKKIEASAKFVPGNSGSPIILIKTGKVVGVATEATIDVNVNKSSRYSKFGGTRRFGYRIDNFDYNTLQLYNKKIYDKDVKMFKKLVDACIKAMLLNFEFSYSKKVYSSSSSSRRSYSSSSSRRYYSSRSKKRRGFANVSKLNSGKLAFLDREVDEEFFEKYGLKDFAVKWNQQYEYNSRYRKDSNSKYMVNYIPYRQLLIKAQRELTSFQKYYRRYRYHYTSMQSESKVIGAKFEAEFKDFNKKIQKIKN
jgi:Trypsin-like peptidase domain/tRNA_anti-like